MKEKLVDFCNVLNIPINKATMKKVKVNLQRFPIFCIVTNALYEKSYYQCGISGGTFFKVV